MEGQICHSWRRARSTKVKLDSEGQEYIWVTLKEALKLPVESYTRQTIEEYIKKKRS